MEADKNSNDRREETQYKAFLIVLHLQTSKGLLESSSKLTRDQRFIGKEVIEKRIPKENTNHIISPLFVW